MDKFLSILSEYLKAAGGAISHYAPQAYQTTLDLIRIFAIVHIVEIVLAWCILYIVFHKSKDWISTCELEERSRYGADKTDLRITRRVIATLAVAGLGVITLGNALDFILGAFFPQLYLVYQVASKAGIL